MENYSLLFRHFFVTSPFFCVSVCLRHWCCRRNGCSVHIPACCTRNESTDTLASNNIIYCNHCIDKYFRRISSIFFFLEKCVRIKTMKMESMNTGSAVTNDRLSIGTTWCTGELHFSIDERRRHTRNEMRDFIHSRHHYLDLVNIR